MNEVESAIYVLVAVIAAGGFWIGQSVRVSSDAIVEELRSQNKGQLRQLEHLENIRSHLSELKFYAEGVRNKLPGSAAARQDWIDE